MGMVNKIKTGRNIGRLCEERSIQICELREMLELKSVTTIYKWYNGETIPSLKHAVNMARIFDVTVDEIYVLNERN